MAKSTSAIAILTNTPGEQENRKYVYVYCAVELSAKETDIVAGKAKHGTQRLGKEKSQRTPIFT